jgi:DNA ligase-1
MVGIPLHPTLGSPIRSLDEIYDRLGDLPFAAEFKLDGQRCQAHVSRSDSRVAVQLFSRHLEDMTAKVTVAGSANKTDANNLKQYPDVVLLMQEILASDPELHSFIIDAEIVAIDPVNGALKNFQELSNRARKDVQFHNVKVAVSVFAFDLLYLDGEVSPVRCPAPGNGYTDRWAHPLFQILLEQPFRKRRGLLRKRLPALKPEQKGVAHFNHVESQDSEDGRKNIEEFWVKAVESRCEGLMIKVCPPVKRPHGTPLTTTLSAS